MEIFFNEDDEVLSSTSSTEDVNLNIETNVVINIDNIQEEKNLIDYTTNHFNTKIQEDFEKFRDIHSIYNGNYRSNSPITISNYDSRSNSNSGSDSDNLEDDDAIVISDISQYKKLSYRDVEKMIHKYYEFTIDNKFSNEIDILTTFIKGQKNLYVQSKYFVQRRLNCLMFPSLLISAFITMIAPFIECIRWSGGLISALNAIIMLCVSFINYLKLESSIENYLYNVKQYDKLETSLEMTNNKLLFIENDKEKSLLVLNKIREVERKIGEIKESTNVLIPEYVKGLFPIICHINIFSFIKKIEIYKKNLIIKFKDVKNEIRYILFKMEKNRMENKESVDKNKDRLEFLNEVKNKLKTEIFDFQSAYSHIDLLFTKEIQNAECKKNETGFCFWRPKHKSYCKGMNTVIDKYFYFIFADE